MTTTIKLPSPRRVFIEMERIAGEQPTKTANCQYATDDNSGPCCIVGTALYNLGVPVGVLAEFDNNASSGFIGKIYGRFMDLDAVELEPEEVDEAGEWVESIAIVQNWQDDCVPWGIAVERAKNGIATVHDLDDYEGR